MLYIYNYNIYYLYLLIARVLYAKLLLCNFTFIQVYSTSFPYVSHTLYNHIMYIICIFKIIYNIIMLL